MKLTYKGTEERVFPSLGLVKPGDVVEASEDFAHPDFVAGGASKPSSIKVQFNPNAKDGDKDGFVQDGTNHERPIKPSAASDTKAGE
jgi:hypothetical protein